MEARAVARGRGRLEDEEAARVRRVGETLGMQASPIAVDDDDPWHAAKRRARVHQPVEIE